MAKRKQARTKADSESNETVPDGSLDLPEINIDKIETSIDEGNVNNNSNDNSPMPGKKIRGRTARPRKDGKTDNNGNSDSEEESVEADSTLNRTARRKKQGVTVDTEIKEESEHHEIVKGEPEKRSLRATNSRRSREALARHLLMGSHFTKSFQKEKQPRKSREDKNTTLETKIDVDRSKDSYIATEEPSTEGVKEASEAEASADGDNIKVKKVVFTSATSSADKNDSFSRMEINSDHDGNNDENATGEEKKEMASLDDDGKLINSGQDSVENPAGTSNVVRGRSRQRTNSRSGIDFRIGGRLEACDFMSNWYASKIVDLDWNEREVLIHFERWSSRFDEWVSMDSHRLRAITRTSARKEHKQKLKEVFKVGENILAKWADGQMYPAKVVAVNSRGSCQVVFLDDGIQKTVKPINLCKVSKEEFAFRLNQTKSFDKKNRTAEGGSRSKRRSVVSSEDESLIESKIAKREGDTDVVKSRKITKTTRNDKGANSIHGLNMRRKKLLVGGIFQAKRTFHENAQGLKKRTRDEDTVTRRSTHLSRFDSKNVKGNRQTATTSEIRDLLPSLDELANCKSEVDSMTDDPNQKKSGIGVAPKEFVIEEDHNHFKCPVDKCGKSFRKESLLASHMKHYHDHGPKEGFTRRRENSSGGGSSASKKAETVPKAIPREAPVESVDSETSDVTSRVVRKKRRGFRHCIAKHKVNMAKRRPLLMYRRKANEEQKEKLSTETSPNSETLEKEPDVLNVNEDTSRKRTFRKRKDKITPPPVVDAQLKKDDENPVASGADETIVEHQKPIPENVSPVFRKAGRKRRWRCGARVTKRNYAHDGDSNDLSKTSVLGSPESCARAETDDGGREEVVNCICRVLEEDGLMMQCETCMAWQHGVCFNIEEEDKVPNKYVCFACRNPAGQRDGYKYWYDQDWWKTGEMASLNFVSPAADRCLSNSILKAHALNGNVLSIKKFLHSLQTKLHIAKNSDGLDKSLWDKLWLVDSCSPLDSFLPSRLARDDGSRQPSMYLDHSYSAPTKNGDEALQLGHEPTDQVPLPNEDEEKKEKEAANCVPESESQVHLLDHLEQMQDEVDHRLDEISQYIEALEAEWEENSPSIGVGDASSIKSTLKGLQRNLDKMQRMSTFQ